MPPISCEVVLVGRDALVPAWRTAFSSTPVSVVDGDALIQAAGAALVSPANSFGAMSGGFDLAIRKAYRPFPIEDRVREAIDAQAAGELPVGCALVVPTPETRYSHLVVAPTMRTPRDMRGTLAAYLAFRAVLLAVRRWNANGADVPIQRLVCPGLATGIGQMDAETAARQMRAAWDAAADGLPRRRSLFEHARLENTLRNHPRRH